MARFKFKCVSVDAYYKLSFILRSRCITGINRGRFVSQDFYQTEKERHVKIHEGKHIYMKERERERKQNEV